MYLASGALSGFAEGYTSARYGSGTSSRLMLFGGVGNKVFLGYLTGSELDPDSISNEYGKYGSKYGVNSIWNSYSQYGSKYSIYSPWNSFATSPPVIVDSSGKFYGYFTVNKYNSKRTSIKWIQDVLDKYPQ